MRVKASEYARVYFELRKQAQLAGLEALPKKQLISELKLYNLQKGEKIVLDIDDIQFNQGEIYGSANGENFEGEFLVEGRVRRSAPYSTPPNARFMIDEFVNKKIGDDDSDVSYSEEELEQSFPNLYGYSKNARVRPMGTAVILSNKKTMIEIVFYNVDVTERRGDGIGKDNHGNLYRVYLSSEIVYL